VFCTEHLKALAEQFIPNINYTFIEKGGSNLCAVCFTKFTLMTSSVVHTTKG